MFTQEELKQILDHFMISGAFVECKAIDDGHINNTFKAVFSHHGRELHYLLQQINTVVFKDPERLMINVDLVTSFLRDKIIAAGGDPKKSQGNTMKMMTYIFPIMTAFFVINMPLGIGLYCAQY